MSEPRLRDVRYGDHARATIDIWGRPDATRLVVFFHGGGLTGGDKAGDEARMMAGKLVAEGWAMAAANYSLYPDAAWPIQAEDTADACVAALRELPAVERWVLGGHSAGAYLAGLVGFQRSWLADRGCREPDGLYLSSGQMLLHFSVADELGVPIGADHPAAPIAHVCPDAPPVLAVAGDADMEGRWDQQVHLRDALVAVGHRAHRVEEIADRDHSSIVWRLGEAGDPVMPALRHLVEHGQV